MQTITGITLGNGVAIGKIHILKPHSFQNTVTVPGDGFSPEERLKDAIARADRELALLCERTAEELGKESASIFESHRLILSDVGFFSSLENQILSFGKSPEEAVSIVCAHYAEAFSRSEDAVFRSKKEDFHDLENRLRQCLEQNSEGYAPLTEPVILMAEELTPSDTMQFPKEYLLAMVTREGSDASHVAILSRMRGIPAISGILVRSEWDDHMAIVNADDGRLILDPTPLEIQKAEEKIREISKARSRMMKNLSLPSETKKGIHVTLLANIADPSSIPDAIEYGAEGIGLFRSEFLFLRSSLPPSEDTQYTACLDALEQLGDHKLVIRTLDIGSDKTAPCLPMEPEDNPAMGYRGIRFTLDRQDLLKTQLRAIARLSAHGKVSVLFPMISRVEEVQECKRILREVQGDLKEKGIPYDPEMPVGIMIETPAAAICSDALAKEVDFFSVGTNDLTQFTLAVDRTNSALLHLYDPRHPAVLSLLRMSVENAHRAGIRVCVCGELAADLTMTETLLEMGVDELSVSPASLLPLREKVRSL